MGAFVVFRREIIAFQAFRLLCSGPSGRGSELDKALLSALDKGDFPVVDDSSSTLEELFSKARTSSTLATFSESEQAINVAATSRNAIFFIFPP
jgi:hypothetical protein